MFVYVRACNVYVRVCTCMYVYVCVCKCVSAYRSGEIINISGWWLSHPSEKYEFVNGKDDIPYMMENNSNVPNHQPDIVYVYYMYSICRVYV